MARAQGTLVILTNTRQVNALLHTNTVQDVFGAYPRAFQYAWSTERSGRDDYKPCTTNGTRFRRAIRVE